MVCMTWPCVPAHGIELQLPLYGVGPQLDLVPGVALAHQIIQQ